MDRSGYFSVGKIVGVHGVKGIVKVLSHSGSPKIFMEQEELLLRSPKGEEKTCNIERANPHKKVILVTIRGVSDREAAESLIGWEFFADEESLPELDDGTYYFRDLLGLSVFTLDSDFIGRVDSIIQTGSNDVYVVKNEEKETLVPALESVVKEIDMTKKIMRVDLPQGL